jgi:hypothetical protein
MLGIAALDTNNVFAIDLMPKIKVSFTLGTCLEPHNTPPHCFITSPDPQVKVLIDNLIKGYCNLSHGTLTMWIKLR